MRNREQLYEISLQMEALLREQRLAFLIDRLAERSAKGAPRSELLGILRELEMRATDHFRMEESLLASSGHRGLEEHTLVHRHLLEELARQLCAYCYEPGPVPRSLLVFLHEGLAAHLNDGPRKPRLCLAERASR